MMSIERATKNMLYGAAVVVIALAASFLVTNSVLAEGGDTRPNIVIFLSDDGGFSDFIAGEVETPNIDRLADEGIMMTQFRTMPTCSPARAVLLSGTDNHLSGLGTMQGQARNPLNPQNGQAGYEGYLNRNVVSVATLLNDAGYRTYMVGKWHLGIEEDEALEQVVFEEGWFPTDRGFDWAAGMLEGGGEHFGSCERAEGHCTRFYEKNPGDAEPMSVVTSLAPDYFSAEYHTDKAIEYIQAGIDMDAGDRKPFFLYYSDTMVHEPNQVPSDYIDADLANEIYNKGWDVLRAERLATLQADGVIPGDVTLPARQAGVPDWNDESDTNWSEGLVGQTLLPYMTSETYGFMWGDVQDVDDVKRIMAQKFVAYLGMVKYFDNEVGRIMTYLESVGEYDNTIFIFFNDNGGEARTPDYDARDFMARKGIDNSIENMGGKNSFVSNGVPWAQVNNTPLDGSKSFVVDGGIRSPPIIVDGRAGAPTRAGTMTEAFATVMDIGPTILDYAGVAHPVGVGVAPDRDTCTGTYGDLTDICPMNGKSLRPIVEGTETSVHLGEPIGMELFGLTNHAMFLEEADALYKLRRTGLWNNPGLPSAEPFRLYNITEDPSEANDLSAAMPEKLQEMIDMYQTYLGEVGYVGFYRPAFFTADRSVKTDTVAAGDTLTIDIPLTNDTGSNDERTVKCFSDWECDILILLASRTVRGVDEVSFTHPAGIPLTARISVTPPDNANTGDKAKTNIFINSESAPTLPQNTTFLTEVENAPTALSMSSFASVIGNNRQVVFLMVAALLFVTAAARAWNVRVSIDPRD